MISGGVLAVLPAVAVVEQVSPCFFSPVVDLPAHVLAGFWLSANRSGLVLYWTATSRFLCSARGHKSTNKSSRLPDRTRW